MKKQRIALVSSYLIILLLVLGLRFFENQTGFFKWIDPMLLLLIVVITFIYTQQFLKGKRKKKNGIPADDELSILIKYKVGYYSYLASAFLWYILFVFKDHFPDTETILGGGILFSSLIVIVSAVIIKHFNNEQN